MINIYYIKIEKGGYKMINAIRDIGEYFKNTENIGEEEILKTLVTKINGDSIKDIYTINFKNDNTIETNVEEFYNDITTKALFYQAGNGALGGALRADFYKEEKDSKKQAEADKKFDKKIKTTLAYCNKEEYFNEVKDLIHKRIKESGNKFFVVFLEDGKYPIDLFKDKFIKKMYSTMFNAVKGKHICHLCGNKGEVFNTTAFKFYTNDKEVYGNIDDSEKCGIVVCRDCLNDILVGRDYTENNLTTYWMGKQVMFLPHNFNEMVQEIYESSLNVGDNKKFLDNISVSEEDVLEELGKGNTETDIIFFEKDGSKTFYIYHTIKSMLPSRFSELAVNLKKYNLKLFNIIKFSTAIKVGLKGIETTDKERLKMVDSMFSGRRIDRNLFFKRAMMVYKYNHINYPEKKETKFMISNIGKSYNFLVDCRCLQGGFDVMSKYADYEELFENNKEYFAQNEKKAWFLIGRCYDYINYLIKKSNAGEDGKAADRSSLDKNFFFSRKFDFKDFVYFSNLLNEKMNKYRIYNKDLKNMLTEGTELIVNGSGKLSTDEAKFIFFWGMNSFFKQDNTVETENDVNNEMEEN